MYTVVSLKTFFLSLGKKYKDRYERYDATNKFHNNKENQNIILDGEFAKFWFAIGVSLYLKLSSEEREKDFIH